MDVVVQASRSVKVSKTHNIGFDASILVIPPKSGEISKFVGA